MLEGFFDAIVTACDVQKGKPHPGEAAQAPVRCWELPSCHERWRGAGAKCAGHLNPFPAWCVCPAETFLRAAELIGVEPRLCVGYEDAPMGMQAIKVSGSSAWGFDEQVDLLLVLVPALLLGGAIYVGGGALAHSGWCIMEERHAARPAGFSRSSSSSIPALPQAAGFLLAVDVTQMAGYPKLEA